MKLNSNPDPQITSTPSLLSSENHKNSEKIVKKKRNSNLELYKILNSF